MGMSDHIKQQVLQEFFCQKRSHSPGKRKTRFFCFTGVGEPAHISKISYLFEVKAAWHTVLICCTLCGTEQPKEQPQIGDRGSNQSVFNLVFSIRSTCSRSLLSFANILYFTWRTLSDLTLLSYVFAPLFLLKMKQK